MEPYAGTTTVMDALRGAGRPRRRPAPGAEWPSHIMPLLERYEPISLPQIDASALMSRIDTKYVMSVPELGAVLAALTDSYRVLEVEGVRLNRYQTLYFDTAGRDLYASHQTGRAERYKVRSRSYLDSGESFLEVKHKTNKGRTIKERVRTGALLIRLTPEADRLVHERVPLGFRPLQPTLWNEFLRLTLVSKTRPERATFDLDVRFWAGASAFSLTGVVIAEVKQGCLDRNSEVMRQVRALGIHPTGFSKYCVGTAMLFPEVKHNRFKPVLRTVHHVMRGEHDV